MQSRSSTLPVQFRDPGLILALGFAVLLFPVLVLSTLTLPWIPQVVVLLSVLVGLFFFTKPEIALLTFFGLRVIIDLLWWVPVEVMSLNMMELFSGAVAGLAMVLFYLELKRFNKHPAIIPFVPYLLMVFIASFRNLDAREGVEIVARYLSTFLLMFLVSSFMSTTAKRIRMHVLFTITSVVPILVSLYYLGAGRLELELDGYDRLVGGYHNLHNHALMMMLFGCVGVFWLMYARRLGTTILFAVYTLAVLVILYFTYVRTAQLGLVICAMSYLLLRKRYGLAVSLAALAAVGILSSVTLQDRFDDLVQFFSSEVYESERNALGSGRWALWTVSMKAFLKNPIGDIFLGLGLGKQTTLTEAMYSVRYYSPEVGYIDPHNDYLSLMYQMGPAAVICYVAFQIQVMRTGMDLARIGRSPWARELGHFMVAISLTVFFTNFVSNSFISRITVGWYYWGMAGLLFGEWLETRRVMETRADLAAEAEVQEHKRISKLGGGRVGALAQPGMHTRSRFSLPWGRGGGRRSRR
jgi:O-antigen ligase